MNTFNDGGPRRPDGFVVGMCDRRLAVSTYPMLCLSYVAQHNGMALHDVFILVLLLSTPSVAACVAVL